ncbi:MAG: hypothetical protein JO127_17845 [Caulobacteraceae bacterium]|nr:hypothetical protein [Caulobacteraceae bacterium]
MPNAEFADLSQHVLRPTAQEIGDTRILFFGPNAADTSDEQIRLHGYRVAIQAALIQTLRRIGFEVTAASDPEILFGPLDYDYLFAFTVMAPFEGHELLAPAIAAYRGIPSLGGPATLRPFSEDKVLGKVLAASLGVGVAEHRVVSPLSPGASELRLPGRWILKTRGGTMSEDLALVEDEAGWRSALAQAADPKHEGRDFIAEEFVPGLNLSVPVIEGFPPQSLPVFIERGDPRNNILTLGGKDGKNAEYASEPYDGPGAAEAAAATAKLAAALTPLDYARFDFRYDPERNRLAFLEVNLVCALGPANVVPKAAALCGVDYPSLIGHIVTRSLRRQRLEL